MNFPPQVSVIVPVYNSSKSVEASLRSLFAQSLRDIEIIAVDDASTDDSAAVIERLASLEPRLKVIRLAENRGVHEARAAGLRASAAPWIGFMDADDFASQQLFQRLLDACLEDDADIAICGADEVDSSRRVIRSKVRFNSCAVVEEDIFRRFCRMRLGTGALWNKLYRRELITPFARTSWRWRQDANEDTLVNIGCFLGARRVRLLDEQLYGYVIHEQSATQSTDPAAAYCRLLRAFAVAVDHYGHRGYSVLDEISRLYSIQLAYPCYQAPSPADLNPHEKQLGEALSLLAEQHPVGLAVHANRPAECHKTPESVRTALKTAARPLARLPRLVLQALSRRITGA
jgi:glycosyltransferase involved in cell wall biosynthesis